MACRRALKGHYFLQERRAWRRGEVAQLVRMVGGSVVLMAASLHPLSHRRVRSRSSQMEPLLLCCSALMLTGAGTPR